MSPQLEHITNNIVLSDGRNLSYLEFGNPNGETVIYCHGFPGSRFEALFLDYEFIKTKFRIIAIDRPGMGLSDFQNKRQILDFPDDIVELTDKLKISHFSVLGGSGGGPYALACAYKLSSDQIGKCIVISGLGPYKITKKGMNRKSKNSLIIARYFPWTTKALLWLSMGRKVENETFWENNYRKLSENVPKPDQITINDKKIKEIMIKKTMEGFKSGTRGPAYDFNLYTKYWGFELKDIQKRVQLYHGELDINVPITMAKEINKQIPKSELKIYPQEGHLSTLVNNIEEILNL